MNPEPMRQLADHLWHGLEGYVCFFSLKRLSPKKTEPGTAHEAFFKYPEQLEDALDWLANEDKLDRDLYFCAHVLVDRSRQKTGREDQYQVHAIWADGDGALIPDDFHSATVIVESSPGRHHYYWRLDAAVDGKRAEDLNKRFACLMGFDKSGADLSQLLRVPGTVNHKYEGGAEVRLIHLDGELSYDPDLLAQAVAHVEVPEPKRSSWRYRGPIEPRLEALSKDPPVPLSPVQSKIWTGRDHLVADDGKSIDRSRTLMKIAGMLREGGANPEQVYLALLERDESLGYLKYTLCGDARQRYEEIVGDVFKGTPHLLVPEGLAALGRLREAEHPEDIIQEILDSETLVDALAAVSILDERAYEAGLGAAEGRRGLGRKVSNLRRIVKAARAKLEAHSAPQQPPQPATLRLDGQEVPTGLLVPFPWSVDKDGVHHPVQGTVAHAPVVITERLVDGLAGAERLRLAWQRDTQSKTTIVSRAVALSGREIIALAGMGFPVTSESAGSLVKYLAAFEALNLDKIPVARVSSILGWQGEGGRDGFLLGRDHLTCGPDRGGTPLHFSGVGDGEEQAASGFHTAGTMDGWLEAMNIVKDFPIPALFVYASLSAPLLEILQIPTFIVDNSNETTSGKSTVLHCAASVWGCPPLEQNGVINGWDNTRVWREQRAALLNGLPMLMDDTKRAHSPQEVSQFIYDVTSGIGRGRGDKEGTRATSHWRTVVITNGESPMISFTQDGGSRARVLEIWGAPFKEKDSETARMVIKLAELVDNNYGHAGTRWMQFILDNEQNWDDWRERYRAIRESYQSKAGSNVIAGRLA